MSMPASPVNKPKDEDSPQEVFLVHGHDHGALHRVARLVEKLGLRAVILHEQPNQGRTLLEKFEAHRSVTFVVAILTGDDLVKSKSTSDHLFQPRPNVVFELGYFFGFLGRSRVAALYDPGVTLPSDIAGLVYIPMDSTGTWMLGLAREFRAAGLRVDLNRL
jgi:predicted nucleotide-binding protein